MKTNEEEAGNGPSVNRPYIDKRGKIHSGSYPELFQI